MKPNPARVLKSIVGSARPFSDIQSFSSSPGIYGVFFFGSEFPLASSKQSIGRGTLIYLGKTESSQIERDLRQHFTTGETGRSTLRRSIGALLREQLNLKPEPRSHSERSARKYQNYKFDSLGEERLTGWMKTNLGLSFYEYDETPSEIERLEIELIRLGVPILNIKNNPLNPYLVEIKSARSACVRLARSGQASAVTSKRSTARPNRTVEIRRMSRGPLTLHEAMAVILVGCADRTATFKFVSSEISRRGLYFQRAGSEAPPSQIRLRARKYPHLFEIIPPSRVRLR